MLQRASVLPSLERHEHRLTPVSLSALLWLWPAAVYSEHRAEMLEASQTLPDNIWTDSSAKNWRNFCSARIVKKPRLKVSPPCREQGQNRTSTCFCSACTPSDGLMSTQVSHHVRVFKLDDRTFSNSACGNKINISDEMMEHVQLCLLQQNWTFITSCQDASSRVCGDTTRYFEIKTQSLSQSNQTNAHWCHIHTVKT